MYKHTIKSQVTIDDDNLSGLLLKLLNDSKLNSSEIEFSKTMAALYSKHQIKSADAQGRDRDSWYRSGAPNPRYEIYEWSPSPRNPTYESSSLIPRSGIIALSDFNSEFNPFFSIYTQTINQHLLDLRKLGCLSQKVPKNFRASILIRAVEMKNLSRIKYLVTTLTTTYHAIVFPLVP